MLLSKEELGLLIKEARKLKSKRIGDKFTQNDLAEAIGKSRSYIGDIEVGRTYPSYRILSSIANACDVPLSFFGDTDSLLEEIIERYYPDMNDEEKKDFAQYIKESINSPVGIVEWDLNTWKDIYDDFKKYPVIPPLSDEELDDIQDWQKKEDEKYLKSLYTNQIEFKTAQEAIQFILKQPTVMGFGGFDSIKMSDEEIIDFANELLRQIQILSYKYKK